MQYCNVYIQIVLLLLMLVTFSMPSSCCVIYCNVIYCKCVIYLYYHDPCGTFSEMKKSQVSKGCTTHGQWESASKMTIIVFYCIF